MSVEQVRAILVGCGMMSSEWIRCAQGLGVDVVALVDVRPEAAAAQAQAFGLNAKVFAAVDRALAETPADALFDITQPAAHLEVCAAALRAGLHVLEEKPLALNLGDARTLIGLAAAAGKVHAVMQNRRFNPGIRQLRAVVASGVIGEVTSVHADLFIAPHFGGFRERMPHVFLQDMAIHPFDAARYLTGKNAVSVYCEEWNPPGSWFDHGSSVVASFTLADLVRFTYRASWCADGFRTSWDSVWRVVGTQGTALWDGTAEVRVERVKATGGFFSEMEAMPAPPPPTAEETRGHHSVMRQFLAAIHRGPPPETRSADNLHSLAMVTAAVASAESGVRQAVEG